MKATLTGILSLELSELAMLQVRRLRTQLPSNARPIPDTGTHITLMKLSKQDRLLLAPDAIEKIEWPEVMLEDRIQRVRRELAPNPQVQGYPREAWFVLINASGQITLREFRALLTQSVGITLSEQEIQRPFHVSIANLTGNPMASVGDIRWDDVVEEHEIDEFQEKEGMSG